MAERLITILGTQPKVSVAYATFNENLEHLKQSMESILAQTLSNWELVVAIEPGDRNAEYFRNLAARDPRVKPYFSPTRLGRTPAINKALDLAGSEFIARLDSDDYCFPTRLEDQATFLDTHPEAGVVGCDLLLVGVNGEPLGVRKYPSAPSAIRSRFVTSNGLAGPGVMIRQRTLDTVGVFDPRMDRAEDLDYWLRCFRKDIKFHNLAKVLLGYRTPANQFEKRDRRHRRSTFLCRARHSFRIWPAPLALASFAISLLLYLTPTFLYNRLFNHRLANGFRGVSN